MDTTKATAVLFDFDGVVVDTETQYSHFWHEMGKQYLGMDDIEGRVKGRRRWSIFMIPFFRAWRRNRPKLPNG